MKSKHFLILISSSYVSSSPLTIPLLTSPFPSLLSPYSIPSPPFPSPPFPQVGSLDGRFSQYCGFISAQSRANKDATDVVESLEEATKGKTGNVTNHWFTLSVNIPPTQWLSDSVIHSLTTYLLTYSLSISFFLFLLFILFLFLFLFLFFLILIFLFLLFPFSLSSTLSVFPSLYHFLFLSLFLFLSGLLEVFMSRNKGQMPKQIIIYRDGVSDSQFQSILESELPSIQGMFLSKLSAVLCCAVLYCTVLCCAVLCCAVLFCDVLICLATWSFQIKNSLSFFLTVFRRCLFSFFLYLFRCDHASGLPHWSCENRDCCLPEET